LLLFEGLKSALESENTLGKMEEAATLGNGTVETQGNGTSSTDASSVTPPVVKETRNTAALAAGKARARELLARLREADEKDKQSKEMEELTSVNVTSENGQNKAGAGNKPSGDMKVVPQENEIQAAANNQASPTRSGDPSGAAILARLKARLGVLEPAQNGDEAKKNEAVDGNATGNGAAQSQNGGNGGDKQEDQAMNEEFLMDDDDKVRLLPNYDDFSSGMRHKVWLTLDDPNFSNVSYYLAMFVFSIIILSVFTFVLETVHAIYAALPWFKIEAFCVIVFTIEYVNRFIVCPSYMYTTDSAYFARLQPSEALGQFTIIKEIYARARFMLQPNNVIDLIAILPTFVEWFAGDELTRAYASTLVDLRAIRLTRLFRLLRLIGYSEGTMMKLLGETMKRSWRMLRTLVFFWAIAVLVFSSIVYYAERGMFFYCSQKAADLGLCPEHEVRPLGKEGFAGLEECSMWAGSASTVDSKKLQCCYGEAW
jgi:hypothetical protein